jgi:hypothetical protein
MSICCLNRGTYTDATIESRMFQSGCRIHTVPEPPIDLKGFPRSKIAARLKLVVKRNVWNGVGFPTPRGLLEAHDSAAPKVTIEEPTGRDSVLCLQELWSL